MAIPKVFVSSTCFDLGEVREQLQRFVEQYGFDSVLSENGDVFYHPDLHTHESCVYEVANCQLFVLLIGGRFGGGYVADKQKSVTNAEYLAARENNIPVFTYVRKGVLSDHHIYTQNKKKDFVAEINYPSIEKQQYATDIFSFIDEVRRHPRNNAIEAFDRFNDIESHLRKQWAGMFFDMLKDREVKAQIDVTNHLISGISASNRKLEDLVKSLYRSSDETKANKEIESVEITSVVERFFDGALFPYWLKNEYYPIDASKFDVAKMVAVDPNKHSWSSYLVKLGLFEETEFPDEKDGIIQALECVVNTYDDRVFAIDVDGKDAKHLQKLFESCVQKSTADQREAVLIRILKKYGQADGGA